jgi:hypothetical protein
MKGYLGNRYFLGATIGFPAGAFFFTGGEQSGKEQRNCVQPDKQFYISTFHIF